MWAGYHHCSWIYCFSHPALLKSKLLWEYRHILYAVFWLLHVCIDRSKVRGLHNPPLNQNILRSKSWNSHFSTKSSRPPSTPLFDFWNAWNTNKRAHALILLSGRGAHLIHTVSEDWQFEYNVYVIELATVPLQANDLPIASVLIWGILYSCQTESICYKWSKEWAWVWGSVRIVHISN